jgi:hypothetical protein
MTKTLRRRHLQIWILLALLIPAGIISALMVRPQISITTLLQPETVEALPKEIKKVEKENYIVSLRSNAQLPMQLEWINKKVLTYPSATIYKTIPGNRDVNKSELIGRIEARGTYRFILTPDSTGAYYFILYDFIKQQVIDSIDFAKAN